MKPKNKAKRLKARQDEYDALIKKKPELSKAFRRPGSVKK